MQVRTLAIGGLAAAILTGAIGAVVFYLHVGLEKPVLTLEGASHQPFWKALSCRAQLYLQKAEGDVSGISITELWEMTLPGVGFHCTDGTSLEASVRFSTVASEDDRKAGERIFHERCSVCHGGDGSGGVPSRLVLELGGASLGCMRLSDHAARSMI